jgi:uncharacterized protein (UPF0261 family)
MIELCIPIVQDLVSSCAIHGIVSAAGTSGSSLATALMRNCCPIGFPKLQVSTAASGDIRHYIEETDITMMYSVVDIAGMNSILKRILGNAAGAIVGMTTAYAKSRAGKENPTSSISPVSTYLPLTLAHQKPTATFPTENASPSPCSA